MKLNQKLADRIMERVDVEELMLRAFTFGKNDYPEKQFIEETRAMLDKKFEVVVR
jgi:hypothetical protein